ncbi:MAG: asparagine synthase (glutamine-hydrolyzing) [Mariprofundaceae bacterium]
MCGIAGIYQTKGKPGEKEQQKLQIALQKLAHRGPDGEGIVATGQVLLGHRRLAILDTSELAAQPMRSADKRFTLVYNGEIYNFKEISTELQKLGHHFQSSGDTEVVLHALMQWGIACLHKLNGCFAFAFYDQLLDKLLLVRDRSGIKPLYYQQTKERLLFASEPGGLYPMMQQKEIDKKALLQYLHLNYIPGKGSIFKEVQQVPPGHFLQIEAGKLPEVRSYIEPVEEKKPEHYKQACEQLRAMTEDAVQQRLIADVPLGAFLSGGIDSSVIVAMAARHSKELHTFSIGFSDQAFFDETAYAQEVAEHFHSRHTAFSVSEADVLSRYALVMDRLSEPFADSSALVVNLLSELTRGQVTVALSGDGGDELFAGYHKHSAEWQLRQRSRQGQILAAMAPLWAILPKGRGNAWTNRIRQFDRFAQGFHLSPAERYWQWAGFTRGHEVLDMLHPRFRAELSEQVCSEYASDKSLFTQALKHRGPEGMQEVLTADRQLVLPGDMLHKTDRMSMAHSLEVRVPLLDYRLVDFAAKLPADYLIDGNGRKKILRDAFRPILPESLYHRPKKGFEVPLRKWLIGPLNTQLQHWSGPAWLEEQGIFNAGYVQRMIRKLHSNNPGDTHARLYGFLVFQEWYQRYLMN